MAVLGNSSSLKFPPKTVQWEATANFEEVCLLLNVLAKRPAAPRACGNVLDKTPYQVVPSPRLCSTLTPASHSDIGRVKVQTSSTYTEANKWQLSVTLGPEAKTVM